MLHCEAALTVRANCWFHCGFTVGSSAYWVVQRVGQDTRQDSNRAWYVCVCVWVFTIIAAIDALKKMAVDQVNKKKGIK